MKVSLLEETGLDLATTAMRLSRGMESIKEGDSYSCLFFDVLGEKDKALMLKLLKADKHGEPHSVALRMIQYSFVITAPLYWWKQMDRYSVGKTQASSSTMYNIMKRELTEHDFSEDTRPEAITLVNSLIELGDFDAVIANLPCGYMQTRMVQFSLPTLRRVIHQRKNHKLKEWTIFIDSVLTQVRYRELLEA